MCGQMYMILWKCLHLQNNFQKNPGAQEWYKNVDKITINLYTCVLYSVENWARKVIQLHGLKDYEKTVSEWSLLLYLSYNRII
jgi:hypothetical protein